MVTREQSLNNFLQKADEVVAGKYLFATKKIEEMLATISSSQIFFEVFEFCCTGEDPETIKDTYISYGTKGASGSGSFTMPDNPKQIIALCFYVLKEITENKIDFTVFLTSCFPGPSFLDSYDMFINLLVIPFRNTVKNVVETVISASNVQESRNSALNTETNKPDIDLLYLLGLADLLEDDRRAIVNAGAKDSVSKDLIIVLDAMIIAARSFDTSALRPLFVAYKYAVLHLRKIRTHYEEVEELLTDHHIIGK